MRLEARSLARTAGGCSPPHGIRPRGSGRCLLRVNSLREEWSRVSMTHARFDAKHDRGGCTSETRKTLNSNAGADAVNGA
jgi:hypothetical protein